MIKMEDVAQKVTERLYDEVKCKIISNYLTCLKKSSEDYDEFTKSLTKGNLDE